MIPSGLPSTQVARHADWLQTHAQQYTTPGESLGCRTMNNQQYAWIMDRAITAIAALTLATDTLGAMLIELQEMRESGQAPDPVSNAKTIH